MEPDKDENISNWVIIGICITAYIFFIYNLLVAYLSLLDRHGSHLFLS
jgi:hypothetical protein